MFYPILSSPELSVTSLASGSSGNAFLVQAGETCLLIDAGLSLHKLASGLAKRKTGNANLVGILLTHEHTDHSLNAGPLAIRSGAPIIANSATLAAYHSRHLSPFSTRELRTSGTMAIGPIGIRSFPVPHDAVETVGYVLECGKSRITCFTDAGCVTPAIREAVRGVKLAIVEANHDLPWLLRGPYTPEMKARVASDTGHLSNSDCADLLAERLDLDGPLSIWLAHLSRVNNSSALARRFVTARIRTQTTVPFHLDIALRDEPSAIWCSDSRAVQLSLL